MANSKQPVGSRWEIPVGDAPNDDDDQRPTVTFTSPGGGTLTVPITGAAGKRRVVAILSAPGTWTAKAGGKTHTVTAFEIDEPEPVTDTPPTTDHTIPVDSDEDPAATA